MLILLVTFAVLLAWLSTLYPVQFDWTKDGRHTLSSASQEVLARMQGKIEITSYARKNPLLRDAIKQFIGRYQGIKPDIVLHFINPDAVPDEVRSLGISVNGELVIRYQERTEHVQTDSEEAFTNALQRLSRKEDRWLAFVEGHGERNPLGKANHDLGEWVQQLANRGFKVQPININETRNIPDNTAILVLAGPQINLLPGEVTIISNFLAQGGNLLWLADPGGLYGLEPLADSLSIKFHAGTVVDFAGQLIGIDDPTIALITPRLYAPHPVTQGLTYTTLFPTAVAIDAQESEDWQIKPVLTTGDHTWAEAGELVGEVGLDQGSDVAGPLHIGISIEREIEKPEGEGLVTKQQRIVVMGDGDFLSNTYLANSGNLELGLRLINWLSADDDFIAIPAKVATDTQLDMSGTTLGIIGLGFLFVLPLLLLGTGVVIGWQRKKS
jgi:ABC-type uncharacterized transport system involved in gliding motility auxiliary subunit